jgi:hypothetical protein
MMIVSEVFVIVIVLRSRYQHVPGVFLSSARFHKVRVSLKTATLPNTSHTPSPIPRRARHSGAHSKPAEETEWRDDVGIAGPVCKSSADCKGAGRPEVTEWRDDVGIAASVCKSSSECGGESGGQADRERAWTSRAAQTAVTNGAVWATAWPPHGHRKPAAERGRRGRGRGPPV